MNDDLERVRGAWDTDAWTGGEVDTYDDDSVFDVEFVESFDPDDRWNDGLMPEALAESSDWQEA